MLERARKKVPGGEFHEADLHDLPLPDDHVDAVGVRARPDARPRYRACAG